MKHAHLLIVHHYVSCCSEQMVGMAFWSFTKRTVYKDETLGLYHMMAELNMKVQSFALSSEIVLRDYIIFYF